MTAPSDRATLASVHSARIAAIHAEEGAAVTSGEVVVSLDDRVEAARTKVARAEANSSIAVDLARAEWERAQREVRRIRGLSGDKFASSKELDDATTTAAIAKLKYEKAQFNLEQSRRALAYEEQVLAEYQLRAPFSGYITEHHKHVGETVDQLEGIVTLIRIDPLEVVLDCPIALAPFVHAGDAFDIVPQDKSWMARQGVVSYVSREIDGASQTFVVKLAVENPDERWMSGMKVSVDFGAPIEPDQGRQTSARPPPAKPVSFPERDRQ